MYTKALWVMIIGLLLAGCAPRAPIQTGPPQEPQALFSEAGHALQRGYAARAEELYTRLAHTKGLSKKQRSQAWQGLSRAARETGHLELAELALRQWAGLDPKTGTSWEWQSRLLDVLWAQGKGQKWLEHLSSLIREPSRAWSFRLKAALYLCQVSVQEGRPELAWPELNHLYSQAGSKSQQQELQEKVLQVLHTVDNHAWIAIKKNPPPDATFPAQITAWVMTVHDLENGDLKWPQAWSRLIRIADQKEGEVGKRLQAQLADLEQTYGLPSESVALLCPLSGGYARIGWKIALGASVAQWQLSVKGLDLDVHIVNSADPEWISQVQDLPGSCRLVGGPLRQGIWQQVLHASGLQEQRTFFPFRTDLAPGRQGVDGFRFFPGPKDQIQPLLDLLQDGFGIQDFAVIYPRGRYGRRMSSSFWQTVVQNQGRVTGMSMYPPNDPGTWKDHVAELLQVDREQKAKDGKEEQALSVPDPDFQAVFVPDAFTQAQMLIPEFFYFDQNQLLFLGPTLWSQDLERVSELDRKYFQLALMTAPWLPDDDTPAARSLRQGLQEMNAGEPDFWIALGYDFVRLAQRVQARMAREDADPARILATYRNFSWSMAPITWDSQGRATQELYVVQPGHNEVRAVKEKALKARWKRRLAEHQGSAAKTADNGE